MRLIIFFGLIFSIPFSGFAANDCGCEVFTCNACQNEVDIKFYTEKCAGGKRVKSCKKPVCQAIAPAPQGCELASSDKPSDEPSRGLASQSQVEKNEQTRARKNSVGIVVVARGTTKITRGGQTHNGKIGFKIYEKDQIETGDNGKVKIRFKDKNILNVTPKSRFTISEKHFNSAKGTSKTLINLLYGKIRSSVKHKYKDENSYYKIKTKTAVAGVRGTDFVVSYIKGNKKLETKVETIHGAVALSDLSEKKQVEVSGGTYASFVVADSRAGVFDDKDIEKFIARGYMTPVFKMRDEDLKRLEVSTNFNQQDNDHSQRAVASKTSTTESAICEKPAAEFNQCLWSCENNPKGAKRCRTDLPTVNCTRSRCNANGKWADSTRLPASFYDACHPNKPQVKPCDY